MFVSMKRKVVRILAAALLALIASGLPLAQIAQATRSCPAAIALLQSPCEAL